MLDGLGARAQVGECPRRGAGRRCPGCGAGRAAAAARAVEHPAKLGGDAGREPRLLPSIESLDELGEGGPTRGGLAGGALGLTEREQHPGHAADTLWLAGRLDQRQGLLGVLGTPVSQPVSQAVLRRSPEDPLARHVAGERRSHLALATGLVAKPLQAVAQVVVGIGEPRGQAQGLLELPLGLLAAVALGEPEAAGVMDQLTCTPNPSPLEA
jgi:hypothetical protein